MQYFFLSLFVVFSELLSRILDLEGDECDPVENRMCVTVFQYATYFLQIGSAKAIPKALKQIAQESKNTICLSLFDTYYCTNSVHIMTP